MSFTEVHDEVALIWNGEVLGFEVASRGAEVAGLVVRFRVLELQGPWVLCPKGPGLVS